MEHRTRAEVFEACLNDRAQATKVRADIETGQKLGITGTPEFLLGVTDARNPNLLKATKKISGAQPFTAFQAAIDSLLETAEPSVVEEHSRQ
jgi:predicted DsbA family dithiol-disulfide isomerase